jgi:hypothetical protein
MWMIANGNQEKGPYSAEQIALGRREGRISGETFVRAENSPDWTRVSDVRELNSESPASNPATGGVSPVAPAAVSLRLDAKQATLRKGLWIAAIVAGVAATVVVTLSVSAASKKTDSGVVTCLDTRLRASDAWRALAKVSGDTATTQEGVATAAEQAVTDAQRSSDYTRVPSLQSSATIQRALAARFRSRATSAEAVVTNLGNPYLEVIAARRWGSNSDDPGRGELLQAQQASEAAWGACKFYCYDPVCSGVVPATAGNHGRSASE